MSLLSAKTLSSTALPVIDVSGLRSTDTRRWHSVAQDLRHACLDKGFFYISNHGVSDTLIQSVFEHGRRFFDQPTETKARIDKKSSYRNVGYEPLKRQTLEPGAPPDLKEGFQFGVEGPETDPSTENRPYLPGPNQWPEGLPGFRDTMASYFAAILDLERYLWRGLALSLDLPPTHFDDFYRGAYASLRVLHYPPQPANPLPNEKGCGAHTDFGGLTVLLQDDIGGLQVWDAKHGWIHATPLPGTFVCNLGDMIARWTNDRYRSTLHRVVNESGRERYSAAFFFSGNPDYTVSCLPTCLDVGEKPKYPPTNVARHLAEKWRLTYR
jgi:isopenicillin N synthase-like dioxygenase